MKITSIRQALLVRIASLSAACACLCGATSPLFAQGLSNDLDDAVTAIQPRVIGWRRDFHTHPELSNRETRTASVVAKHLRSLGLEVRTGIAHTGAAGLLRGAKPGRTIALRSDMDALPVTEETGVPFTSKVTTEFRGETVGVMHACGHDAHMAILMGVAEILAKRRNELAGQVLSVFQPAEEGAPDGEHGGAELMLEEGLFEIAKPDAVFGLHVMASLPSGVIGYRSGPLMAGADTYRLVVSGRQTHGSRPWSGIDPVFAAAQIITGMQAIVSRQVDLTATPVVLSVGAIKGGIRSNIIPDSVEMIGTLRTFDPAVREDVIARMQQTATHIAAATGATAELAFGAAPTPPVINDPALTSRSVRALQDLFGEATVREISLQTPAEDFSFYGQHAPAFFFWVGVTPPDRDPATAPFNHSPLFDVDESALAAGMRAFLQLVIRSTAD